MKFHILLLLTTLVTGGGTAFCEPVLPENLAEQKASTQKLTPHQDGMLVESDPIYAPARYMFARFEATEMSAMKIDGIESLLDVEKGASGRIFLGLVEPTEGVLKFVISGEMADAKLRSLPIPEEFDAILAKDEPGIGLRLIGTTHEAAAIIDDVVWWLDKTWKKRKLPKVPKFHDEFLSDEPYSAHWFLDDTILYGGWNHGEWGGALASIDLGAADSTWVQLSGKPIKDDSGIPENDPVQSIVSARQGELWVATGSSHMGGTWRGLYHREPSGKWQTLIHGDSGEDSGELKPFISAIDALALDREGSLFLLAGSAGIYRMKDSALEPVIAYDFHSHLFDQDDYTIGSTPSEIAVARNGDIFVSTNCLGILAFRKTSNQWHGKQIVFPKQQDKKDDPEKKPDADNPPTQPGSPTEEK